MTTKEHKLEQLFWVKSYARGILDRVTKAVYADEILSNEEISDFKDLANLILENLNEYNRVLGDSDND